MLRFMRRLGTGQHIGRSMAVLICGLITVAPTAVAATPRFRDTPQHWAGPCIDRLAQLQQLNGYPDGTFRPEAKLTRSEFAVLMLNQAPKGWYFPSIPAILFKDVPPQHWAAKAIQSAYQKQIFVGYPDQTFRPNQSISRVEALSILARLTPSGSYVTAGETNPMLPEPQDPLAVLIELFEDASQTPAWSQKAIATAAAFGLVVDAPQGRRLRPTDGTTRAEAAAFLCQSQRLAGLVPPEAVAGSQYFTLSPELKKLQRILVEGQKAWFDRQRQLTIVAKPPLGWTIDYIQLNDPRVGDRVPAQFSSMGNDAEKTSKWGYLDADGTIAIAPQFDDARPFSEDLADISQGGKYGFIDRTGAVVIPPKFDQVFPFREGLAAVAIRKPDLWVMEWGFIDKTGAWVVPLQPYPVLPFSDGLARIELPGSTSWDRRYGFIDRTGKTVIEPKFNAVTSFSEGLSAAEIYQTKVGEWNPRYGYIDKAGQWVIQNLSNPGTAFSEGLASVTRRDSNPATDDGYGYIDRTGNWVILSQGFSPPESEIFQAKSSFVEGVAIAKSGEKMGIIDRSGKFIVPPKYSDIAWVSKGYAYVNYGGVVVGYISGYDGSATPVGSQQLRGGRWGYLKLPTRN
jgi:hypothetical protein